MQGLLAVLTINTVGVSACFGVISCMAVTMDPGRVKRLRAGLCVGFQVQEVWMVRCQEYVVLSKMFAYHS